ncbi:hypothetical protein ACJRO7_007480 [Eucalyptus globulus]|uniref:Uncharacterized protein n=1 Tax=Eucalyptus globulus TaxID=34317 RepID=A0ABD3IMJ9_EUCGL
MVIIPTPAKPPRIINFLKPYVLKMHFTSKFVSAQVIHSPIATVASSASSQEKALRPSIDSTGDVAAAAKIGKIPAERLLLKGIPAVEVHLKREQKYHGKVKAVIDSMREASVKLLWELLNLLAEFVLRLVIFVRSNLHLRKIERECMNFLCRRLLISISSL